MSRKDRVILESLSEEYGVDLLASAIIAAKNGEDEIEEVSHQVEPSPAEYVLEYVKRLEGYRIRIREMHWSAKTHSLHILADSLLEDLESYEDSIAEDFMGLVGYRIQVGAVVPKLPKATEIKALIDEVINDSLVLKSKIENLPAWTGMVNLIDDCVHMLNKSKYLADFT
jgi:hypothetical protein